MRKIILFSCIILSYISINHSLPSLFPFPSVLSSQNDKLIVSIDLKITTNSSSQILADAIGRYSKLLFPFESNSHETRNTAATLTTLTIVVNSDSEDLQLGVDESYSIAIGSTTSAVITSPSVFGALHALETFSQLVEWDGTNYIINEVPISIKDVPRFPWRGLMIDTARHYLSKGTILRAIDAMSYSKFNVLHWHIVDAQSFPIVSTKYPALSQKGAFATHAVYTADDVQQIVTYAKNRGIRVLPEFDIPGHASSWGKSYDVTVDCPRWSSNINNIPLDPSNPLTFELLDGLITEMAAAFPDNHFHTGGDEVVFGCWENNTAVQQWAKKNGLSSSAAVENYFESKLQTIVANNMKKMVVWQELFNNGVKLDKGTLVEVWKDAPTVQQVVNGGYQAIVAYPYYLDKQIPNAGSTHYEWVDTWKDFYSSDPYDGVTANKDLIIGGEACMWSEQVDSANFDSRVWPRACAVGERLWSASTRSDPVDATTRLVAHRCRLVQRGIGAGPIAVDYCPLPTNSRFQ